MARTLANAPLFMNTRGEGARKLVLHLIGAVSVLVEQGEGLVRFLIVKSTPIPRHSTPYVLLRARAVAVAEQRDRVLVLLSAAAASLRGILVTIRKAEHAR